ncbi:MAG: hypothetical protein H7A25_01315 [Leptospiraceae bacterium]|nr:hypothetical protein [Leptospiraceae bacterium]MCP5498515.1 hypothetical protein [Leptospiraceae bacterium]
METIIIVDRDIDTINRVEFYLSALEYRTISTPDYKKGVEFVRSAAPDLIILGLEKIEPNSVYALDAIKADQVSRQIPLLALYSSIDRNFILSNRKKGIMEHLTKPVDKYKLINLIKELMVISHEQKDYNISSRKSHVIIEKPLENLVKISFKSGLKKYVLPELKNIFSPQFVKAVSNMNCCIDIRDFVELSIEEIEILKKIVNVFGAQKLSIIAGKHIGSILANSDLEDHVHLFISLEDYVVFLKKQTSETAKT